MGQYLACFTEQEIADKVGVAQDTVKREVSTISESFPKSLKVQYQEEDWNILENVPKYSKVQYQEEDCM